MVRVQQTTISSRSSENRVFVRPISPIREHSQVVRECFAEVFPGEIAQILADTGADCDPAILGLVVQSRVRNSKLRT